MQLTMSKLTFCLMLVVVAYYVQVQGQQVSQTCPATGKYLQCDVEYLILFFGRGTRFAMCVCVCFNWKSISNWNIAGSIPAEYGFTRLSSPSLSLGGYQQPKCVCLCMSEYMWEKKRKKKE